MIYWPGSRIVKSKGNAFDWRGKVSVLSDKRSEIAQRNATTDKAKQNRVDIIFMKEKQ